MTVLQKMHLEGSRMGKRLLLENNRMDSFFLVLLPDGKTYKTIKTPWQSPEEKPFYIIGIRIILEEANIPAYTFVTEAWMAKVDRHEMELMAIPPRERSNREDVLLIISRHRNGENYATKYLVEYTPEGKVILGRPTKMPGEINEGLMGNLFEEEEVA